MEYQTKRTIKHFIGQVLSVNNDEVTVNYLKRSKGEIFVWPSIEDKDEVPINNIKKKLEAPKIFRRGQLCFDFDMSRFNFV